MLRYEIREDSGAEKTIEAVDLADAMDQAADWASDGSYDRRVMVRYYVEQVPSCTARALELCRSDMGDGGWSLHDPDTDEILLDGPAEWDESDRSWSRPNKADYDAAYEAYLATMEGDSGEVEAGPEPEEPECAEDESHDWRSPKFLGGCAENPGVWSLGGTAMSFTEVCQYCGAYKNERHNGSQRNPGELAVEMSYEEADERSLAWVHTQEPYMRRMAAAVEAEVGDIDGSGDIGVIVRTALSDDPDATADEIADIVREAREDARAE